MMTYLHTSGTLLDNNSKVRLPINKVFLSQYGTKPQNSMNSPTKTNLEEWATKSLGILMIHIQYVCLARSSAPRRSHQVVKITPLR